MHRLTIQTTVRIYVDEVDNVLSSIYAFIICCLLITIYIHNVRHHIVLALRYELNINILKQKIKYKL